VAEIARLFPEHSDEEGAAASEDLMEAMRIAEALIFAASDPVEEKDLAKRMPDGVSVRDALEQLREHYSGRGINLVCVNRKWTFRTAADLSWLLSREQTEQRKLSRAAIETLAIVAYHQPVTRAEIEDIRGVAISKGTLDVLLETSWVRLRGRRKAPGRPVTYGTTDAFLLHFGLETIGDLPGLEELKAAGLFDGRLPQGFGIPQPRDDSALQDDEDPLEDGETPVDLFSEEEASAEASADATGELSEAVDDGAASADHEIETEAVALAPESDAEAGVEADESAADLAEEPELPSENTAGDTADDHLDKD
jgi:segregation and condensation protein B